MGGTGDEEDGEGDGQGRSPCEFVTAVKLEDGAEQERCGRVFSSVLMMVVRRCCRSG